MHIQPSTTVSVIGLLVAGFIGAIAIIFARYFLQAPAPEQSARSYEGSGVRD